MVGNHDHDRGRVRTHRTKEAAILIGTISKALLAFVFIVVGNLWAQLTATGAVLPHNVSGWVALFVTSIGGSFMVWLKRNVPFGSRRTDAD